MNEPQIGRSRHCWGISHDQCWSAQCGCDCHRARSVHWVTIPRAPAEEARRKPA